MTKGASSSEAVGPDDRASSSEAVGPDDRASSSEAVGPDDRASSSEAVGPDDRASSSEAGGPEGSEAEPGFRDVLRIPQVRAAVVGMFVIMLGFGIVSPVLPGYGRSFGVGKDAVGLLISGFAFARLIADPFVGRF